jgi:N-acetylglutamate synthase-like GNAT family acetyltransferase
MSPADYQVRRATVDDLPSLQALWASMHLSVSELERKPTEFQVAEAPDGAIAGAIGIEISGRAGRIHSECYHDFGLSEVLRQQLWERVQSLATNHGLARLWTRETAPFWTRNGFHPPDDAELKRLPQSWGTEQPGWVTIQLRDEEALEKALDKEFTRFKLEEQRRTKRMVRGGKILTVIGTGLAALLFIGITIFAILWTLRYHPEFFRR